MTAIQLSALKALAETKGAFSCSQEDGRMVAKDFTGNVLWTGSIRTIHALYDAGLAQQDGFGAYGISEAGLLVCSTRCDILLK